ncbi:MAG TPA: heme-binding protein [Actinomycetota bacterium]|nr:heme-binding protein [Actinomycetota bacterium]
MADRLVSHSAGFTRFGRDAETSADELGPLADLVGTWIGSRGWELIAVPSTDDLGELSFRVIIRPYVEVVTFVPIGAPVPDRGGPAGDLLLTGLKYEMRIADAETNEPLHLENGMWFYMAGQDREIARSSAIPHGDCLLALGSSTTSSAAPDFPELKCTPDVPERFGYGEAEYRVDPDSPFQPLDANNTLRDDLSGLQVVETVTLDVSTANGGGVLNIPFVTQNANASAFASTYWIETVEDSTGQQFQQLQYSQQTNIDFLPVNEDDPDGPLIMWPHVNVNTLRKQ